MESQKFHLSRQVIYDGTKAVSGNLSDVLDIWDKAFRRGLIGREARVERRQVMIDWHGAAGSFWARAYQLHTEQKRIEVIPADTWSKVVEHLDQADILSIGVGAVPADLSQDIIKTLEIIIGRTPLVIGRLLLPYLEHRWAELNIYKTVQAGTAGSLVAYGWQPPITNNMIADTASVIPDDGLASRCSVIVSGEGDHRFFVSLAPLTFVTSLGIGITPNQATPEELFLAYESLQQWFSPVIKRTRPTWNSLLS